MGACAGRGEEGQDAIGVFCLPGSGASLEGLVGGKDPYFTRYPIRNRQAWWYAKAGMIAVALPGCANGAPDDLKSAHSRSRYLSYLQDTGWTDAKLIELERCMCQDFLKGRTDFSN